MSATYTYNGDGQRMSKTVNGKTTQFIWDGMNMIVEFSSTGGDIAAYIYGPSGLLARNSSQGGLLIYTTNAHGDVTAATKQLGGAAMEYYYDAYGNVIHATNVTHTATLADNPFLYCGEYTDFETGFTYLRNRYYDPEQRRFITEDPIRDGSNWYIYCGNNPVMFVDPSGRIREPGYVNSVWCENPDAYEFGEYSDTYRVLFQLGIRWEKDIENRQATAELANKVRRLAREGTPVQYAQDKIINELHNDVKWARDMFQSNLDPTDRYLILVQNFYDAEEWNYKWKDSWRVPYARYDWVGDGQLTNMNEHMKSGVLDFEGSYPKNWVPWMYFDGVVISAADMGNLATGYVMASMGYHSNEYHAWNDKAGDNDWKWVEYGATMARNGR